MNIHLAPGGQALGGREVMSEETLKDIASHEVGFSLWDEEDAMATVYLLQHYPNDPKGESIVTVTTRVGEDPPQGWGFILTQKDGLEWFFDPKDRVATVKIRRQVGAPGWKRLYWTRTVDGFFFSPSRECEIGN